MADEAPTYIIELTGLMSAYLTYTTGAVPGAFEINTVDTPEGPAMMLSCQFRVLDETQHAVARSQMDGVKLTTKMLGPALVEIARRAARGVEDANRIITQ